MNKKTISAKPQAASKSAPFTLGQGLKKTTATSADNRAEIEKTVSDILGDILDKKLGEIEKRISATVGDGKVETSTPEFAQNEFTPAEAIPAYYKKSKDGRRSVVFDREVWECDGEYHYEPDKKAIEFIMHDAEEIASEINNIDAKKISNVIQLLDAHRWQGKKRGGLFRRMITDLINFPRMAIVGEPTSTTTLKDTVRVLCPIEIKIGALQLFEGPTSVDEEVELDKKARAPFDAILSAARVHLENAEASFPLAKKELHAVRDELQELAEILLSRDDCAAASCAAKASIDAARFARRALQDYGPHDEMDEEYKRLEKVVAEIQKQDKEAGRPKKRVKSLAKKMLEEHPEKYPAISAEVKKYGQKYYDTVRVKISRVKNHGSIRSHPSASRKRLRHH